MQLLAIRVQGTVNATPLPHEPKQSPPHRASCCILAARTLHVVQIPSGFHTTTDKHYFQSGLRILRHWYPVSPKKATSSSGYRSAIVYSRIPALQPKQTTPSDALTSPSVSGSCRLSSHSQSLPLNSPTNCLESCGTCCTARKLYSHYLIYIAGGRMSVVKL